MSRDEIDKCVEWVAAFSVRIEPLPKLLQMGSYMHGLLFRFALERRREAGKLRVMNGRLYWHHMPIFVKIDGVGEDGTEIHVEKDGEEMRIENPETKPKPLARFTLQASITSGGNTYWNMDVPIEMDSQDIARLMVVLKLCCFPTGIQINLVDRP